ncbi:hypothetical protein [Luteitalea sp.]|uniref:hypothetical protein n=1 Tax=Luteitalea sp. TaxID=2004800 RepID=UPI0025C0A4F6|nr:hypothetical protein [Luteitalea sp.]
MIVSRPAVAVIAMLLSPASVAAQSLPTSAERASAAPRRFEVGAIGGVACTGSEGSVCGGNSGLPTVGGYGSLWITPRLELQARVTRFERPGYASTYLVIRSDPHQTVTVHTTDRSREIAAGHLLYHFGSGPLRWHTGVGYGARRDRLRRTCTTDACIQLPANQRGGGALGPVSLLEPNASLTFGVHGRIRSRWVARGAVTLHNFAAESLSSIETTVALGVRF